VAGSRRTETDASWSPDGLRLAYTVETRAGTRRRPPIFSIAVADASGARTITNLRAVSVTPSWTADGRILFASDHQSRRTYRPRRNGPPPPFWIYSMAADGSDIRRLVRTRAGVGGRECIDAVASPDNTRIAVYCVRFGRRRPSNGGIYLTPIGGGVLTRITPAGGRDEANPAWSPDSRTLAFESASLTRESNTRSDIGLMDTGGGNVRMLLQTPWFETNPVFSPDGTKLAFTSDRDTRPARRRGRPPERLNRGFELYTANLDGSAVTRLTTNSVPDLFPDWGPAPAG
jgi:Tol biopolymer transport system component